MATLTETQVEVSGTGENEVRRRSGSASPPSEENGSDSSEGGCLDAMFKRKGRKPPSNKWLQQQIPACRPVYTAKHVFAVFLVVGVIFVILGIVFLLVTVQLHEMEMEYTNCGPLSTDEGLVTEFSNCEDFLKNQSVLSNVARKNLLDSGFTGDCHCFLEFRVEQTIRYPWKMYYALDNYYQNHRRYLNSWDPDQLRGMNLHHPDSNCRPLLRYRMDNASSRRPIAPCGLISNSWFNDSFYDLTNVNTDVMVNLSRDNIAWESDRNVRFRNPENLTIDTIGTNQPPNWLSPLSEIDGGLENESFIVWNRVAAFPWFRKLYGEPELKEDLEPGNYSLLITYNYPVGNFNGKKSVVISELSWLGGRNLFLGIAYIVTGALCLATAVALLTIHLTFSKWKTKDPKFLQRAY